MITLYHGRSALLQQFLSSSQIVQGCAQLFFHLLWQRPHCFQMLSKFSILQKLKCLISTTNKLTLCQFKRSGGQRHKYVLSMISWDLAYEMKTEKRLLFAPIHRKFEQGEN